MKFQEWERQEIAKANAEVKETAHIVQNTKSDIVELKEMVNEATNELLEILKLIVEKEKEIDEFKEILQKYKEMRSLHLEANADGLDDVGVVKLRKIEESTGKVRKVLSGLRSELKELKTKRDELLGGVENIEEKISVHIDDIEKRIKGVAIKVSTQKNK